MPKILRRGLVWLAYVFGGVIILYPLAVWSFAFRWFRVPTSAMAPTVLPGDHLIATGVPYWFGSPERGDLIVFEVKEIEPITRMSSYQPWSKQIWIKRAAGLPGETVNIQDETLWINGEAMSEAHGIPAIGYTKPNMSGAPKLPIKLAKDAYFALGDHTHNSYDSRGWGPLPGSAIKAKAVLIVWPLSRFGRPKFDPDAELPPLGGR